MPFQVKDYQAKMMSDWQGEIISTSIHSMTISLVSKQDPFYMSYLVVASIPHLPYSKIMSQQFMMSGPELIDNSFKLDNSAQQQPRKRRFKIFDSKPPTESLPPPVVVQPPQQKRELALTKAVEMVKIEPKTVLQREFYGEEERTEEEEELCLLDVRMDQYETVRSAKFFATDCFRQLPTPSMLIKQNRLIINEAGALYQSVQEVRHSYGGLQAGFQDLSSSISLMEGCIRQKEDAARQSKGRLQQFRCILQGIRLEQTGWEGRLAEIDKRIANLERSQDEQLQVFDEEEGQRVEVEEEDMGVRMGQEEEEEDEFVETHYLPAQIIFKMMEERRSQQKIEMDAQAQRKVIAKKTHMQTQQTLKLFHPIFRIGDFQYQRLSTFLREEFPKNQGKIGLQLIFRRGTTDLDAQAVGEKQQLQYKGNLLFLIKTSTGRRIGGFISSCLLQGESMEDEHAFLFTLQEGCHKLPVKAQCTSQAFSCSRHYLVAFSNDLMISANCLQEENYCEWPSSYAQLQEYTNTWLAGDFEFMIQHVEIFEVQLS